jgi:yeast amino acid transporter
VLSDTLKMGKDPEQKVGMSDGSESPDYHLHGVDKMEARRGSKVNEATDVYGDVATAEEYGYVARG